jgi:hypothetical protein
MTLLRYFFWFNSHWQVDCETKSPYSVSGWAQVLHRRHKTLQLIHNIFMRRPNLVLACANNKIQSLNHTWNVGVCPPVTYIRSVLSRQARAGLTNLWHAYTQRHVKNFFGTRYSLLSPTSLSILWRMCVCVCVCVCMYICIYIQGVQGGMCQTSGECSLS